MMKRTALAGLGVLAFVTTLTVSTSEAEAQRGYGGARVSGGFRGGFRGGYGAVRRGAAYGGRVYGPRFGGYGGYRGYGGVYGGRVYGGCNVENASYGLTICAERVALLKALSEGERVFEMIAVVADTADPTPPCGACRQLLWEYCGDIPVVLANLQTVTGRHQMRELLPLPFDARLLT